MHIKSVEQKYFKTEQQVEMSYYAELQEDLEMDVSESSYTITVKVKRKLHFLNTLQICYYTEYACQIKKQQQEIDGKTRRGSCSSQTEGRKERAADHHLISPPNSLTTASSICL